MTTVKIQKRNTTVTKFVRTLIASGYQIVNVHRQPNYIEISCEYKDIFSLTIKYLFVICSSDKMPSGHDLLALQQRAATHNQNLVLICDKPTKDSITSISFFSALGGLVPTWRALNTDYESALLSFSRNTIPSGITGEAWLLFEEAVADGFEFVLGRRAVRLGGKKRGCKVVDIFIQLPDNSSIIIDTKATSSKFDAQWSNLRALVEYTKDQLTRQKGHFLMTASIIVAPEFKQKEHALMNIANEFLAETTIPLVLMSAKNVIEMTSLLSKNTKIRNKINWKKIFGRNGLYNPSILVNETSLISTMAK